MCPLLAGIHPVPFNAISVCFMAVIQFFTNKAGAIHEASWASKDGLDVSCLRLFFLICEIKFWRKVTGKLSLEAKVNQHASIGSPFSKKLQSYLSQSCLELLKKVELFK